MACMEHHCNYCDNIIFNNDRCPAICPKCGCMEFTSHWDEVDDTYIEVYESEEYEDSSNNVLGWLD